MWFLDHIGISRVAVHQAPSTPVVVAIVDDGVRVSHHDLKGLIWTNPRETPGNLLDDDGNPVADAQVSGTWDTGDLYLCTSDADGWCEETLSKLDRSIAEVTLTVIDIAADGYLYDANANDEWEVTVTQ